MPTRLLAASLAAVLVGTRRSHGMPGYCFAECPFAHEGEKATRRCPALYLYSSIVCPDVRQVRGAWLAVSRGRGDVCLQAWVGGSWRTCMPVHRAVLLHLNAVCAGTCGAHAAVLQSKPCPRGDVCPYSHSIFEYWMHPARCVQQWLREQQAAAADTAAEHARDGSTHGPASTAQHNRAQQPRHAATPEQPLSGATRGAVCAVLVAASSTMVCAVVQQRRVSA